MGAYVFFQGNKSRGLVQRQRYRIAEVETTKITSFEGLNFRLEELYRRVFLIAHYLEMSRTETSFSSLRSCRNNLRRIRQVLTLRGIGIPVVDTASVERMSGAWVSDWIDFACGDLNGPVQGPGWCG